MNFSFVFPGQGSQSVGMLADLAADHTVVTDTFNSASEVLGYDLWSRIQQGPAEELNKTHITQPAMLVSGVAVWRVWQAAGGPAPSVMAGHSLGEYTALVCADALAFEDAVGLVEKRGLFMQEAVPAGKGAMAAILGLDDDTVRNLCATAAEGEVAAAVNFNSPGQVVIAGSKGAIERAMVLAKEQGAKRALSLPVSVPSHCDLMKPAAEKLAEVLASTEINTPSIPVIHNADVVSHSGADEIRDALKRQLFMPVRWVETVEKINADGIENLIEGGPGKVLAGLNKRIVKSMTALPVFNNETLEKALAQIKGDAE